MPERCTRGNPVRDGTHRHALHAVPPAQRLEVRHDSLEKGHAFGQMTTEVVWVPPEVEDAPLLGGARHRACEPPEAQAIEGSERR